MFSAKIHPVIFFSIVIILIILIWGLFSSSLIINVGRYTSSAKPSEYGLKFEEITFLTEDNVKLSGWFVDAENNNNKTVIICHGWGADKSNILPSTQFLASRCGYNLLYFDFRNHGRSAGKASSLGCFERLDLESAIKYLKENKEKFCRKIGAYGLSMGGSVAIITAAKNKDILGVVAESPFSSFNGIVTRFAKLFYGLPKFPFVHIALFFVRLRLGFNPETYSAERYISQLAPRPVFIIQGENDKRMPVVEGETLYKLAGDPKELWIVKGADHGDPYSIHGKLYEDKIAEFFIKVFKK